MRETVYNLFAFCDRKGRLVGVGCVPHQIGGLDEVKLAVLQGSVSEDAERAQRHPLPMSCAGLTWNGYQALCRHGQRFAPFDALLESAGAGREPLVCITAVVEGTVMVEGVERFDDRAKAT